jgi:hypothetical protein
VLKVAMPESGPQPFLVSEAGDTFSKVDSEWDSLLNQVDLKVKEELQDDINIIGTSPSTLWGIEFSSKGNKEYFGASKEDEKFKSNAWVGDEMGCRLKSMRYYGR